MPIRTYKPQATVLATITHRYLTRWQAKIEQDATGEQLTALAELIACLATFITKWPKPPPVT